jgi:Holliday junction resolvase RusA-like endonuclease
MNEPDFDRIFFVAGTPRPQGSARPITTKGGRTFMKYGDPMSEWRNRLVSAFSDSRPEMIPAGVPVMVEVEFTFARPVGHSRKRRESDGRLKTNGADLDKLARLVLDALGIARVYDDDRQVTDLAARKRYVSGVEQSEGVWVRITESRPDLH